MLLECCDDDDESFVGVSCVHLLTMSAARLQSHLLLSFPSCCRCRSHRLTLSLYRSPISTQTPDDNKFIDATGTFVAKEDLNTKVSKVITPIYESTSTFYGSDSDAVEDFDTSLGSSRAGYYKFRIADFMGGKATAIDIADFDNAWHEAFNMVHGTRDGIYFAGESIFKIEDEPEQDGEDGMLQGKWVSISQVLNALNVSNAALSLTLSFVPCSDSRPGRTGTSTSLLQLPLVSPRDEQEFTTHLEEQAIRYSQCSVF